MTRTRCNPSCKTRLQYRDIVPNALQVECFKALKNQNVIFSQALFGQMGHGFGPYIVLALTQCDAKKKRKKRDGQTFMNTIMPETIFGSWDYKYAILCRLS